MKDKKDKKGKMPYIHTHILVLEEYIKTINKNLKWLSYDLETIKKLSKPSKNKNA